SPTHYAWYCESEILADYYFRRTIYVSVVLVLTMMVLVAVFASIRRQLSLERTNRRFDMALENMTHGLCMFDAQKRLFVSNKRYAELYCLPPKLLKIGTSHRAIVEHRVKNGIFADENDAGGRGQSSATEITTQVKQLADGRVIRIVRQPI